MTKKLFCAVTVAILAVSLATSPAAAQITAKPLAYIIPQDVDPPESFFTARNQALTFTGAQILTGIELHALIPEAGGFLDVIGVNLSTDYPLTFGDIESLARGSFLPWSVVTGVPEVSGHVAFFFDGDAQARAPMNDAFDPGFPLAHRSFALVGSGSGDPAFASATFIFRATQFGSVRPLAVPEPGILSLAFGFLTAGSLVVFRRKHRA